MKNYQEITLLPVSDVGNNFLWQKIYKQLHLALASQKVGPNISQIGIAFPEYNLDIFSFGTRVRLFAENEIALRELLCEKWLGHFRDYVHVGPVMQIPIRVDGYACFKQIRLLGNKEKLARRRSKRTGEPLEQALMHFDGYEQPTSKLPFINVQSETNSHKFRLYIEKIISTQSHDGTFSCYGLSGTTTIPIF